MIKITNESLNLFKKNSEFIIPFTLNSSKTFIGIVGKVIFHWIDKRLNNDKLINTFEAILPDIELKENDLDISYLTVDKINGKTQFDLKVRINNNLNEFKKVVLVMDNTANFVVTGLVRKKILIYPKNSKEIVFGLIPLFYGNLKLPPFKVIEYNLNSTVTNLENEKKSIYFVPEHVNVTGFIA